MAIRRPPSHVIGDAGERVFAFEIPRMWTEEWQRHQYGLDYLVQAHEAHLATGLRFCAQIKTTEKHPRVDGRLRVPVSAAHLEYWLREESLPVFLIAVDLDDEHAYFVDVDELVPHLPVEWTSQREVTVGVPEANRVRDHAGLRAHVRKAWERRQGPHAALLRRKRALEAQDPRFLVKLSVTETGERVELFAQEPGSFTISMTVPPDDQGKISRVMRGYKVDFKPGEVQVEGMPLLAFIADGGSLQIALTETASLSFRACGPGGDLAILANMPATIVRGLEAVRLSASLGDSLILVEAAQEIGARSAPVSLSVNPRAWAKKRVRALPYFDAIHQFLRACRDGATLQPVLHLVGENHVGPSQLASPASFEPLWRFVEALRKAREVCDLLNIDVCLPAQFSPKDEADVGRVHALLFSGEYRAPARRFTFSAVGELTERIKNGAEVGDVEARFINPEEMPFLERTVCIETRAIIMTAARVAIGRRRSDGLRQFRFSSRSGEFIQRSNRFPNLEPLGP